LADEKKNIQGSESVISTPPISNSQLPATDIIDVLMKPEMVTNYTSYELKKVKRKRKKKRLSI